MTTANENELLELAEDGAGAKNARSCLLSMFGDIYRGLDAEDRKWVDKQWLEWRGEEMAQASAAPPEREAKLREDAIFAALDRASEYWTTTLGGLRTGEDVSEWISNTLIPELREQADKAARVSRKDGEAKTVTGDEIRHYQAEHEVGFYDAKRAITAKTSEAPSTIPAASQEYVLRAMAKNYQDGNSWDHLDRETVIAAADEIKTLRAAIDRIPVPPSPVQDKAVAWQEPTTIDAMIVAGRLRGLGVKRWREYAELEHKDVLEALRLVWPKVRARPPAKADAGEIDVPLQSAPAAESEQGADPQRGWQLVPAKATREMVQAAYNRDNDGTTNLYFKVWEAMLSAAPAAEQGVAVSVEELAYFITSRPWGWDAGRSIARALLDKYSIRSAMMTEGRASRVD
jgi:hypothetical protein